MGNLLDVVVHAANLHDTKSGILVARKVMGNIQQLKLFQLMLKEFQCPVDISEKN